MPTYSQAERPLRVETTLEADKLVLVRASGEEALSRPFRYVLEMVSTDAAIAAADVLRQPMVVSVLLPDGEERYFHGIVSRFQQAGRDQDRTAYRAEVVAWPWFLSLKRNCRIFQKKSVLDIVQQVFKDSGFSDFRVACGGRPVREFIVQYNQSDLDFVHMLLEREGIFYFFEHEANKHTLVLADANSAFENVPGAATVTYSDTQHDEDSVFGFEQEFSVHVGVVTLQDFDHLQPSFSLLSSLSGEDGEEIYDYTPGRYVTKDDGERYAQYRLEAEEAQREKARGRSTCRQFVSGHKFTLARHFNDAANREYIITSVRHVMNAGGFRSGDSGGVMDYSNDFTCIPSSVRYRTRRRTPRPVVRGTQTAIVVGPSGEEIWTDEHGRVKVQFHWDRDGRYDENSSCWIRVSHPWAGGGWGAVSIPRIGQEVIVDFLEGDPDQPIIVGRVYNAQSKPPYALPDGGNVSGIKSNSTPGGGGYNEMSMNDAKGKEKITIHAQYNMDTTVENDQTLTVHNKRTAVVDSDETMTVHANQKETIDAKREVSIGSDDKLTVSGKQDNAITGNRKTTVGGNDTLEVTGNLKASATGNADVITSANGKFDAAASLTLKGGASVKVEGPMVTISGAATIKLESGGSSITMTPASINISSPMITVSGSGMVTVTGGLVKVNS